MHVSQPLALEYQKEVSGNLRPNSLRLNAMEIRTLQLYGSSQRKKHNKSMEILWETGEAVFLFRMYIYQPVSRYVSLCIFINQSVAMSHCVHILVN